MLFSFYFHFSAEKLLRLSFLKKFFG